MKEDTHDEFDCASLGGYYRYPPSNIECKTWHEIADSNADAAM
jgi:hypothetical protein